ncbi:hypothetical protein ACT8ZV_15140 [Nocardioides sp. MAHUQ-72]|uniref:hypothetical protein n=1 Tax=unclassified Nocardioides TaxID=2615069 RepID=UPI003614B31E
MHHPVALLVTATATVTACGFGAVVAGTWTQAAMCERDQRRDLVQMERMLSVVQPEAIVQHLRIQCGNGGDALLAALAPRELRRREVTHAFELAGWRTAGAGWELRSPDGEYVVRLGLWPELPHGRGRVALTLHQSDYRPPRAG